MAATSPYTGGVVEPSELERRLAVLEAIVDARLAYLGPAQPGQVLTLTLGSMLDPDTAHAVAVELAEIRDACGAERVVVLAEPARLNLA